ncbi:MAG: hypothetical protein V3R65_07495 [Acidiferrobacterales bacterium]
MRINGKPVSENTRVSRRVHLLAMLIICLDLNAVLAQDENKSEPDPLERTRLSVTYSLNYLTRKLDAFFGDNREYEDTIGSWVKINLQARVQEKASTEFSSAVQVRIALPRTESRFNIVIESDANEDLEQGLFSADPVSAITDPTYSGGLRYIIKHSEKWYAHADAGIQFGAPIDVFTRGRLRRNFKLNSWRFQAAETLTLYQSGRAHAVTQADLEHLLTGKLLFRNRLSLSIRKAPEVSDWSFDASFIQRLDSAQAMQYQYIVRGNYATLHATDFSFNLRYRRRLQHKWIFLEIIPQALYSEANNFAYTPSIYFKLEMLFRKD